MRVYIVKLNIYGKLSEYKDWGVVLDEIAGSKLWRYKLVGVNKGNGLFGGVKKAGKGSGAITLAFKWFLKQKILKNNLTEKYNRFIITRSDQYYKYELNLKNYDPKYIWIPNGEDYGGLCDRHMIVNKEDVIKVLSIIDNVVKNPLDYPLVRNEPTNLYVKRYNPEKLFALRLKELDLMPKVKRYDRMFFTAATQEDDTRWKKAREVSKEKVLIKYPTEYELVKNYLNINEYL